MGEQQGVEGQSRALDSDFIPISTEIFCMSTPGLAVPVDAGSILSLSVGSLNPPSWTYVSISPILSMDGSLPSQVLGFHLLLFNSLVKFP